MRTSTPIKEPPKPKRHDPPIQEPLNEPHKSPVKPPNRSPQKPPLEEPPRVSPLAVNPYGFPCVAIKGLIRL